MVEDSQSTVRVGFGAGKERRNLEIGLKQLRCRRKKRDDQWAVDWTASCALIGCMLGAMAAGLISDRIGRKKTLFIAAVLFAASAIGTALPQELAVFIIFRMLGGIASMTSPMYIAEISPAKVRGRLVSVNQFAIISGMLVVYFVNLLISRVGDEAWNISTGWRWMFASGILPSVLFFILLFFVPESPRWLTKQGRRNEALAVLTRVGGGQHANTEMTEIEDALSHELATIGQLFEPGMKIVLIIGVVLAVLQQVTGINVFLYYAPEIFKKLGSGTDAALLETVVVGAVNLGFTILAIWTVDKLGRKPLMLIGSAGMGICLFALGMAGYLQKTELWVLAFILGYIACFALSLGPVVWVVLSEIFPTKIRGRAMAIATFCLWGANYIISQTFPMLTSNPWLQQHFHNAFAFWLYGAMCIVTVIFVAVWVPETKGRSLEEIEKMWIRS